MKSPLPRPLDGRGIIVSDEDLGMVSFIVSTLRAEGHAVFDAYDALAATQLALGIDTSHLLISDTRVNGEVGIALLHRVRDRLPTLPILYLANIGRSSPEIERELPPNVPILREPFTAQALRAVVNGLLDGEGDGRLAVEGEEH
jgi:DNA-binding response OmpR family regulator